MLFRHSIVLSTSLLVGSACVAPDEFDPATGEDGEDGSESANIVGTATQSLEFPERSSLCSNDPRVIAGIVSLDVCIGAELFLREDFNGNGRSCATCHKVDGNFAIDPDTIARLPPNDPLFVAEFNPTLAKLEVPAQMRRFGLILENVDGFLPSPQTRFVLRSVPHNLSMGVSVTAPADGLAPAERTGWSADGAPNGGALIQFQQGAITQHYTKNLARVAGRDFRLATQQELVRIEMFMRQLGRTNDVPTSTVVMRDTRAEAGRQTFIAVGCNGCHGDAGANASFGGGGNRNFNTGVETARHAALAAFPRDGGLSALPANPDGSFGDGSFNTPGLVEAADTGPFFHTAVTIRGASDYNVDVATTIEEAIAFYDTPAFNNSPSGQIGPINIDKTQIDNIGRYLRGINAAFNVNQAQKRLDGALALVNRFHNTRLFHQREMLRLANVEVEDALDVLRKLPFGTPALNTAAVNLLTAARSKISEAQQTSTESTRVNAINAARSSLGQVNANIGTNLNFNIGQGTLMF